MATHFNGFIEEFPTIRIDSFRQLEGKPSPYACFLSHYHSDHLQGLESSSYNGPLIYCSEATKLLVLNVRSKKHQSTDDKLSQGNCHGHLKTQRHDWLRSLSIGHSHLIELHPRDEPIQVTLIDANHCPGSVMFLIQNSKKSILFTGDVRAEPWFVENLVQQPYMAPFMTNGRRLDCIYVDSTFAYRQEPYIEIIPNSEGISDLLSCLEPYSKSTPFVFTWTTLGYERLWVQVSCHFQSKIHLDEYNMDLLQSIKHVCPWVKILIDSCLTTDPNSTRFHACSKQSGCPVRSRNDVVYVSPVINYTRDEVNLNNMGAPLAKSQKKLLLENKLPKGTIEILDEVQGEECRTRPVEDDIENTGIQSAVDVVIKSTNNVDKSKTSDSRNFVEQSPVTQVSDEPLNMFVYNGQRLVLDDTNAYLLPTRLAYLFSRHSSYHEIRNMVEKLRPKSVYPCFWTPELVYQGFRMSNLFRDVCSSPYFRFDLEAKALSGQDVLGRSTSNFPVGRKAIGKDASQSLSKDAGESSSLSQSSFALLCMLNGGCIQKISSFNSDMSQSKDSVQAGDIHSQIERELQLLAPVEKSSSTDSTKKLKRIKVTQNRSLQEEIGERYMDFLWSAAKRSKTLHQEFALHKNQLIDETRNWGKRTTFEENGDGMAVTYSARIKEIEDMVAHDNYSTGWYGLNLSFRLNT